MKEIKSSLFCTEIKKNNAKSWSLYCWRFQMGIWNNKLEHFKLRKRKKMQLQKKKKKKKNAMYRHSFQYDIFCLLLSIAARFPWSI